MDANRQREFMQKLHDLLNEYETSITGVGNAADDSGMTVDVEIEYTLKLPKQWSKQIVMASFRDTIGSSDIANWLKENK